MVTPSMPTIRLTYDELLALQARPEYDGRRLELIDGELLVSPTPTDAHQRVSSNMVYALEQFVRPRGIGAVYAAPLTVRFSEGNVVQPDIIYLSRERAHLLVGGIVAGAPDLVMEILSRSTRREDVTRKKALYERFGVPEYWIIDYEQYAVTLFALVNGRYVEVPVEDETARSRVLPGFAVALADLFEAFP